MSHLLPWLVILLLMFAALPTSFALLQRTGKHPDWTLAAALSVALAFGGLTVGMFWLGLLGVRLDVLPVTLVTLALLAPGSVAWWRMSRSLPPRPRFNGWEAGALLLLAAVTLAVLFNAAYWPFSRDDAIGIYHAQAEAITSTHALLPLTGADSLYLTYPPLMPLAYAYSYLLAGWEQEYLARTISAMLGLAGLLAAYALGREVDGRLTGLLAAVLLAVTPTFGRWASAGYVDLPVAFFITLAAVFALRFWRSGSAWDAALAGGAVGLAAWTKNAALIEVVMFGVWLLAGLVLRRANVRAVAVGLGVCALVAAPWYVRNLLGAGFLVPDTAWTEDARPTLETLLLFVTRPEIYGEAGLIYLAGVLFILTQFLRRRNAPAAALLLLWVGPFFGAWWLLTSYDPRLLLPVLPIFAVIGAWTLASAWRGLTPRLQRATRMAAIAVAVLLTALSVWNNIEFKNEILRDPLMSDNAKRELVLANRQPAPEEP
jgi:hypothetical protein